MLSAGYIKILLRNTQEQTSVVISCFSQAQELNPTDISTLSYTQHTHNLLYIKYKKYI